MPRAARPLLGPRSVIAPFPLPSDLREGKVRYHRPGCGFTRHLRTWVHFDGPERAERAGFRPCRKCDPTADAGKDRWMGGTWAPPMRQRPPR